MTLNDSLGGATFDAASFTAGFATVTATLDRAASQTVTASDTSTVTVTAGTSNPLTVTPGAAAQLLISASPPATVAAGSPFGFTVTAFDTAGNVATGFSGTATVALANNPGGSSLGGTLIVSASSGVAVFSGLSFSAPGSGYTLAITSPGLATATTGAIDVPSSDPTTLTLTGAPGDIISIQFTSVTTFAVTVNGTTTNYSTASVDKLVYNGSAGAASLVVFDDPISSDSYTAIQSLTSAAVVGAGFEFDANNVMDLYVYVSDPSSTATVGVANTDGSSNFFVGVAGENYSYIAAPGNGASVSFLDLAARS